jgi:non-heme Fe2+,alpha-ketoglutarate-dependent halogenase
LRRPADVPARSRHDWATLVRGKDTFHHFEHVPSRDLEPEALAFHKMVSEEEEHVRVFYRGTGKSAYRA